MVKANSFCLNGQKIRAKCFRVDVKGTEVIIYRQDRKFKVIIDGEPFPIPPIYEQFEFSAYIAAMDYLRDGPPVVEHHELHTDVSGYDD